MAVRNRQIGWSPMANALYDVLREVNLIKGQFATPIPTTTSTSTTTIFIPTVIIGTQEWMLENLNVDRYRNGDVIEEVQDQTLWAGLTTGAWCWYNNNSANGATYGRLYNWYAINDPRGIAPTGFHIPTDTEWTTLMDTLGGLSIAGGELKEAGTSHWLSPNTKATNSSGFTGLPGGNRTPSFGGIGRGGHWWSSTEADSTTAYKYSLEYQSVSVLDGTTNKTVGHSVRAIKN